MAGIDNIAPVTLYREISGDGPYPVVFLHGWACGIPYWDQVRALLPGEFRSIAVDLRGFGRSPKVATGYTFYHHERDLLALVDELGLERFALVGHSLGGALALHFALAHAHLLSCLVVVDSAAATEGNEFIANLAKKLLDTGLSREEMTAMVRRWFYRIDDADLERFVDLALQAPPNALAESITGLTQRDMRPELEHLNLPVKIFYGEHDRNRSLQEVTSLRDSLPDAELYILKNVAHCPQVEAPGEFTRELVDFLRRKARW